jgi:molybdate transport system substrate-binding protein
VKKILAALLLLCAAAVSRPSSAAGEIDSSITVFAAASLTNVLQELGDAFAKDSAIPVRFSFAASSTLARQIENGSPADIFFSADLEWMDYLQNKRFIQVSSRHDMLGNRLVLIAPAASTLKLKIEPHWPRPWARIIWPPAIRTQCPWAGMRKKRSPI